MLFWFVIQPHSYYSPGYPLAPSPAVIYPPATYKTKKSVALQTGESISDNSQTFYNSAEDETYSTRNSIANFDNTDATNITTSAHLPLFQDAVSRMGDSTVDISFSIASQQPPQHRCMFLSNHYGPDKLLHGSSEGRVPRSASLHTSHRLIMDSPPPRLRVPRSQAFYPGVNLLSHSRGAGTPAFPTNHPS